MIKPLKTVILASFLFYNCALALHAQQGQPGVTQDAPVNSATIQYSSAAGPDDRTWTDGNGHKVVEMATGLNFWDGQQWSPSSASFQIIENGNFAIATNIQHKVRLSANLNTNGAVSVITPDGLTLNSTPVAIALYDAASGNFATIASITNCNGFLLSSNKIVYSNAFVGLCADVVYTLDRGSFHQDVVLNGRLNPADFGFPNNTTRIQILTEFYQPPRPDQVVRPIRIETNQTLRSSMASPDFMDRDIGFGNFVLSAGRAYTAASADADAGARVGKQFVAITNQTTVRTFLIESVEYPSIQNELNQLPDCDGQLALGGAKREFLKTKLQLAKILAPHPETKTAGVFMPITPKLAEIPAVKATGFVIDYIASISGAIGTASVLQADTTYFVSGNKVYNGSLTIEGGAVVKYPTNSVSITLNNSLTLKTSNYRPAVFTAADDNSVGDVLTTNIWSGYTGTIRTNGYGNPDLWFGFLFSGTLNNLRFSYAKESVRFPGAFSGGLGPVTVGDALPTGGGSWDPQFNPAIDNNFPLGHDSIVYTMTGDSVGNIYAGCAGNVEGGGLQLTPLVMWDGLSWSNIVTPIGGADEFTYIFAIKAEGNYLYVAGRDDADLGDPLSGNSKGYVAKWDGTNWTNIGGKLPTPYIAYNYDLPGPGVGLGVKTLVIINSDVYIGGDFIQSGTNTNVQYVARFDGTNWAAVGNGLTMPTNGAIRAIASVGNTVYIGGDFTAAGGNTNIHYLARLEGNTWTNVGDGVNGAVHALTGCGNDLFVGGAFTVAGGISNANCIAKWDGANWNLLGRGLSGTPESLDEPRSRGSLNATYVRTIVARGNEVFAGGSFSIANNGSGTIPVNNVAKATWSEDAQSWTWSGLDGGATPPFDPAFGQVANVNCSILVEGAGTNAYNFFVGGFFENCGETTSFDVGRWIAGAAAPDTNIYKVNISIPTNMATCDLITFSNLLLTANVTASGTNTLSYLNTFTLYVDGQFANSATPDGTNYFALSSTYAASALPPMSPGLHSVMATYQVPGDTNAPASARVQALLTGSNTVTGVNDLYAVFMNDAPTNLAVLANDSTSTTNALRVVSAVSWPNASGWVQVSHDQKTVVYRPNPNTYGTDTILYSVTDGVSTNSAFATVKIRVQPAVVLQGPPDDGDSFITSSNITIRGVALDYDTTVSNIAFKVNGSLLSQIAPTNINYQTTPTNFFFGWNSGAASPQTSYANFAFTLNTNAPGYYEIEVVATDSHGLASSSTVIEPLTLILTNSTTATNAITASIDNLTAQTGVVAVYPVVRDGLFDLQGKAKLNGSNNAAGLSYQLLAYRAQDNLDAPFANVTPGSRDAGGFHSGGDVTNDLGTLDLTGLPNGVYDLLLTVRGGGKSASATNRFLLDSPLKIGQFSFSQQDLVIPVNGIPLSVTRTYNSLNPDAGDFGFSWTYALNSMDISLDEERTAPISVGSDAALFADEETDGNGLPRVVTIRTGGGRNVTLTLPDGRRTTFEFTPRPYPDEESGMVQQAVWTPPAEVHATLTPLGSDKLGFLFELGWVWQDGGPDSTFDTYDVPGWTLTTQDGTQFVITRDPGMGNAGVTYQDPGNAGHYINVQAYGPPKLTRIVQRTGDAIQITDNGIFHYAGGTNLTRSVAFERDTAGRISAIHDPVSGTNGWPSVRYLYDRDNGNLVQVLKLVDRTAGTYTTNQYRYDNASFPHYLTSIEDATGAVPLRTLYDDQGRMIGTVDAFGKTNSFTHDPNSRTETIHDRLGNATTYYYDTRGNVTNTMDALGNHTQMQYDLQNNVTLEADALNHTNFYGYDSQGNRIASTNALVFTNGFVYNTNSQLTVSTDARGFSSTNYYDANGNLNGTSDALGHLTTNFYNASGLEVGSRDAIGTLATNYYDTTGNLLSNVTYVVNGGTTNILNYSSFAYDANGNQTNQTVWRKVGGSWTGATTTSVYDGQNRLVQTIDALNQTNTTVYNVNGQVQMTVDKLGRVTSFTYDDRGQLVLTTYPDNTTEGTAYDDNGRRIATTNRLNHVTTYGYDVVGRLTSSTNADTTVTSTVYDAAGRVQWTLDARGVTNAFGYDALNRRTSVTNAYLTPQAMVMNYTYDQNGNQLTLADALSHTNAMVYDALNRVTTNIYPDSTTQLATYDAGGRRVLQTDQAGKTTQYGYDGIGRLITVTNALNQVTGYAYDEAGNQNNQVDALTHTTSFEYDALGRRTKRLLPGSQAETFGYDANGNQQYYTNFNGVVITNQYDVMNRLTNRLSTNGYQVRFTYTAGGQRQTMNDASGLTTYVYDVRDRLATNLTPQGTLVYGYDNNGNETSVTSSTSAGTSLTYQYDPLNRLINVIDARLTGSNNTVYGFDAVGNLQLAQYPNGITNLYQYDPLNRLTNLTWKSGASVRASFYYQLGAAGNRTNLVEVLNSVNRTNQWSYDAVYKLTSEVVIAPTSGTLGYGYDVVGNRTSRTASGSLGLTNQTFTFNNNDWLNTDSYDNNGSTTNSTGTNYLYDVENRLTNANNGGVLITYNGDGSRVSKTVGGVTTLYLVDTHNPSGYAQVVEELTVSGSTNLTRAYTYGMDLISERLIGSSTNYYGHDGHGSVRFLTSTNGTITDTYTYDAYGVAVGSTGSTPNHYLYCGEQYDPDLGFYYLRARYLNPNTGRFWTMDTSEGGNEDPLSLHKYLK